MVGGKVIPRCAIGLLAWLAATSARGSGDDDNDNKVVLGFAGASCFDADTTTPPFVTFFSQDRLALSPFGEMILRWRFTLELDPKTGALDFVDGAFVFLREGSEQALVGTYRDFVIYDAAGTYRLIWRYEGGSGEFAGARGSGTTRGMVDLVARCARYEFAGRLRFRRDDGEDD